MYNYYHFWDIFNQNSSLQADESESEDFDDNESTKSWSEEVVGDDESVEPATDNNTESASEIQNKNENVELLKNLDVYTIKA